MQTAGRLIGSLFEFATELQDCHHAFERRDFASQFFRQLFVHFDRNPSPVIFDRHRSIGVDRHFDVLGIASHRFVDRIVNDFIDKVMQAPRRNIPDIHGRALPDMFHVRKMLQVFGRIVAIAFGSFELRVVLLLRLINRFIFTHGCTNCFLVLPIT